MEKNHDFSISIERWNWNFEIEPKKSLAERNHHSELKWNWVQKCQPQANTKLAKTKKMNPKGFLIEKNGSIFDPREEKSFCTKGDVDVDADDEQLC